MLEKIAGWRARLATNGRQVLREVLDGPLRFDPSGEQYRFDGEDANRRVDCGADR